MANYVPRDHLGEDYDSDRSYMTPSRRRKIHKHRKWADTYGPELPFKIGGIKPKLGKQPRDVYVKCEACGRDIFVTKNTCMVICKCGELMDIK
jgi:hypothetical protein